LARRGVRPQPKHPDFEQEETEGAETVTILRSLGYLLFEKTRAGCAQFDRLQYSAASLCSATTKVV
jgi:hypothetical protein